MSELPVKIGKYQVTHELGRGSMGVVYAAHDPFSERPVALKVAHPHFAAPGEGGQRFRKLFFNEAHAAGLLHHPNIVRVFDADMDGEICYLVMEYVTDARTLVQFTRSDSLLPVREVVGIIYNTAKALDYAHRQGVIHRDIKPSNLLLNAEGEVKLADFSIAMVTRTDVGHTQFTGILGSPLYMSPEQINDQTITGTSDIFSLGSVMYQLLTGHHPFRADTLAAIGHRISREEPPAVGTFRDDFPEGLDYTVRRMLKKETAKRYQTGLDLAADLAVIFEDLDALPDEDAMRKKFRTIKQLDFFSDFTDADIWELIRACRWQHHPPGARIIEEGESEHAFYVVLSGVVAIEKHGRYVDSLQEGNCFGEMGYLTRSRRSASVVARTEVSLMRVNAASIDRANEATQLRFHKVFVRVLIARLSHTTDLL